MKATTFDIRYVFLNEQLFKNSESVSGWAQVKRKLKPKLEKLWAFRRSACGQSLLFGRVKRERASERRSRDSCAPRASTVHDIPQMESLLAGY